MKRNFPKIWIAGIFLIFAVGGILAYQFWWLPKQEIKAPEGKLSGWKIYRNEKYGYEIRYPPDWQQDEGYQEPDEVAFSDTQFWGEFPITYAKVFIKAEKVSKDFVIGWKETVLAEPDKWKITEIGGVKAVEEEFGSDKTYTFMSEETLARYRIVTTIRDVKNVLAPGGGTIPESVIDPDRIPLFYQKIFDQILSNFRFLE